MGIMLPDVAEVRSCGHPFHGLWKDGYITLPNAETKSCPDPANGSCVLLRVPGQPEVSRTTEELAADEAAGIEWRNYGLISGGRIGAQSIDAGSGFANVLLIDSAKKRWQVRIAKNSSVSGAFTLALRRFGHIDGTVEDWTSTITLSLSDAFWSAVFALRPLLTIAQNMTGREFIMGAVNGDGATAMAKVNISGTVDTQASGLGITVSSEVIEWAARENYTITTSISVLGECTSTTTDTYTLYDDNSGLPAGQTHDRYMVWVDGTLSEDNGEPEPVAGYHWTITSTTDTDTSTKVKTTEVEYHAIKHVWAGYVEDALKMVSLEFTETAVTTNDAVFIDHLSGGYYWDWDSGPQITNERLDSKIGDSVVYSHALDELIGQAGSNNPPGDRGVPFAAENLDGYSDSDVLTISTGVAQNVISYADEGYVDGGVDMWRSFYLWPLPSITVFGNAIVALLKRTHPSGSDFTYTTISIHAPSLASQDTTVDINSIFATWHPALDVIATDTEKICWF